MKKLTYLILIVCLGSTMSCSTLSRTKEKLDFLNDKIDKVKEFSKEKAEELKVLADKTEADLQAVGIEIDADKDGFVTKEEAANAAKDVLKGALTDREKFDLAKDPKFWSGLVGLVVIALSKRRRNKSYIKELEEKASANA